MTLCLSVCVSVTSQCYARTAKRIIMQTMLHDSTGTLVFWLQRSRRNYDGATPNEAPNAGEVSKVASSTSPDSLTCQTFVSICRDGLHWQQCAGGAIYMQCYQQHSIVQVLLITQTAHL